MNEKLDDLFKNQSDLQKQIKSSIMEFDGFSFCKEKKAELSDRKGEIETERSFKVDRFVPSHPPENGSSFRNSREKNSESQKIEEQRVNFFSFFVNGYLGFFSFWCLG